MKSRYIKRTKKQMKAEKNFILGIQLNFAKKCQPHLELKQGVLIWECLYDFYSPNFIGIDSQKKEINKIKMALELQR
jgi:hypothetical protein